MRERLTTVRQLFAFMHDVSFPYVVLRNWDGLPDRIVVGTHGDLDLLVYDRAHFLELFPFAVAEYPAPRVRYRIPVGDTHIFVDVREVGDGYYPKDFADDLLQTREWNPAGFWTPSPQPFRIALAYHVVHHKGANTYPQHLGDATVEELLSALKASGVGYDTPSDPTVGRFFAYELGATAVVEHHGDRVVKKQRAYKDYDLLGNEARILSACTGRHFPQILGRTPDSIVLEDCGVALTADTLPADWKAQLAEILLDLQAAGVEHRDIKPDNLLVKDAVIKLIDFGWARLTDDAPDDPPACLGLPYRPSWGPDDLYAMRRVIKELAFQQEEALTF